MSAQPVTWAGASLLDCAQFIRGVTYTKADAREQADEGLIPIFRANNIQSGKFDLTDLVYVPKHLTSQDQVLKPGDVVIATSSGSISVVGKAAQVQQPQQASFGAFCGVLRPSPAVNAKYFGHFFSSKTYRDAVSEMARGVNINNLKRDHFQAINIPLAPLPEQQRIADKLDTVLTRVDAVNDRLARVAPLLKRFRQAVLAAATSGRLTADWRENDTFAGYPKQRLAEFGSARLGKMLDKQKNTGIETRYLRNVNVRWFGFDLSDLQTLRIEPHEREPLQITDGDLLICEGGEPGRCAVWSAGTTDIVFQKALHRVRVDSTKALPEWIAFSLKSLCDSAALNDLFTGTTIKHLTGIALTQIDFPMPSIEEQSEIVRRVDLLFAFADRLEARLQAAQTAASRLTPALLAKAFRGELVPQDPADEPAAELLKRLAASQPQPAAKRGRTRAPTAP